MNTTKIIGFVFTMVFALGVVYVYDMYVAKQEFDITKAIVSMLVVLIAFWLGGKLTSLVVKQDPSPKIVV